MGFLSNLFGGNKEDKALREALAHIHRILDDEKFQMELVRPAMKAMLESAPAYDKDPNGTDPFGFIETNPIPVNGPIGQLAYLSRLETQSGQRILFHRLGAIGTVDVFEAVSFNGAEWFILFVDLYHPRRSRLTPDGFRFTKDVAQFSGFHKFCENFPYDFVEKKASEILAAAAQCISDRAATRDLPAERSMARTVAAFNALTGHTLQEREGWLFMVALKAARATAGSHNPDDYTDGAAYFALAGESAQKQREE